MHCNEDSSYFRETLTHMCEHDDMEWDDEKMRCVNHFSSTCRGKLPGLAALQHKQFKWYQPIINIVARIVLAHSGKRMNI